MPGTPRRGRININSSLMRTFSVSAYHTQIPGSIFDGVSRYSIAQSLVGRNAKALLQQNYTIPCDTSAVVSLTFGNVAFQYDLSYFRCDSPDARQN